MDAQNPGAPLPQLTDLELTQRSLERIQQQHDALKVVVAAQREALYGVRLLLEGALEESDSGDEPSPLPADTVSNALELARRGLREKLAHEAQNEVLDRRLELRVLAGVAERYRQQLEGESKLSAQRIATLQAAVRELHERADGLEVELANARQVISAYQRRAPEAA